MIEAMNLYHLIRGPLRALAGDLAHRHLPSFLVLLDRREYDQWRPRKYHENPLSSSRRVS